MTWGSSQVTCHGAFFPNNPYCLCPIWNSRAPITRASTRLCYWLASLSPLLVYESFSTNPLSTRINVNNHFHYEQEGYFIRTDWLLPPTTSHTDTCTHTHALRVHWIYLSFLSLVKLVCFRDSPSIQREGIKYSNFPVKKKYFVRAIIVPKYCPP